MKNKYKVEPTELIKLLDGINNIENGFIIPSNVIDGRIKDLKSCIDQLISISPTIDFEKEMVSGLSSLEGQANDLKGYIELFSLGITKYKAITDRILEKCKDSFAVTITTLKIFQARV